MTKKQKTFRISMVLLEESRGLKASRNWGFRHRRENWNLIRLIELREYFHLLTT